jgi:ribosome recycling factor
MSVNEILKDADHRMDQSIESMKHDFQSIRTGRANPLVLERVKVDYYGVECPINQSPT